MANESENGKEGGNGNGNGNTTQTGSGNGNCDGGVMENESGGGSENGNGSEDGQVNPKLEYCLLPEKVAAGSTLSARLSELHVWL